MTGETDPLSVEDFTINVCILVRAGRQCTAIQTSALEFNEKYAFTLNRKAKIAFLSETRNK